MKRRFSLLLAAAVLAGCGASAAPASPIAGEVRASAGSMQVVAAPARLQPGGTVTVTLEVTGPVDYDTGCVQTLHIWAVDSAGKQVWEQPVPEIACMALGRGHVPAGKVGNFTAQWPVASTLAPGAYTVHGLFLFTLPLGAATRVRENLPVVAIQVNG